MLTNNRKKCLAAAGLMAVLGTINCKKQAPPPPRMLPEVSFQTLKAEKVTLTKELPGRITASLVAEIRPQVNGLIQKRLFQEGSEVKAGSVLYQIDPSPYRATLEQAKAALASAEAGLPAAQSRAERMKALVGIKAVGQQEADEAQAAYQRALAAVASAKATMESARINLANTPIKAPISGRIGKSNVTVGGLVTAYQPQSLATLQQLNPIYVDVTQSSADLLKLRRSLEEGSLKRGGANERKVKLILEDGSLYPLEGKLQFRDATVDPSTGAVTLRMVFPNPKQELMPGMFVRAIVEDGMDEAAILAMQQGITRDVKGNAIAMVLDVENKVQPRMLELDRAIGDQWLVKKGLVEGDRLIVEGIQKIRPGMPVKATPFKAVPFAPKSAMGDASQPPVKK